MRTFIAVNLGPPVRDRISAAVRSFPVANPPWRWTRPETWHITLKFLGEIPDTDVAGIEKCLERVGSRHPSFDLTLREFGGFPNLRKPRVLFFAAAGGATQLERLAADVNRSLLEETGFPLDNKRFSPHITVARVKSPLRGAILNKIAAVSPLENAVQTVASIDLMKSELRLDGAVYGCLKGFALPPPS
jgi:2'-5' RNA ligase